MSEEQRGLDGITAAITRTDWTRYTGQASYVKRRGERRKRRLQAGAALGTTVAVVGVAVAIHGSPIPRQGAAPAGSSTTTPEAPITSAHSAIYPSFPADLPTTPKLIAKPGTVLSSGVIGAGTVGSHSWQISYRVIPSGSAANSEPQVSMVDLSLDGTTVATGAGEGALEERGYQAMDQYFQNSGLVNPMILVVGSPSPGVTKVDLRWGNGTVVHVPIRTVTGLRFASFAFDPANPPEVVEQDGAAGVSAIKVTHEGWSTWTYDGRDKTPINPGSPPVVSTPTGPPDLSVAPHVAPHSSGVLGEGTVSGHPWQIAYEVIPSGSALNESEEAFCTEMNIGETRSQGGCTAAKPFGTQGFSFSFPTGPGQIPLVASFAAADPGTTAVGFEWADGTRSANAVTSVEGTPMAAVAFDPDNAPAYLLEFGSYGEYRFKLVPSQPNYTWTFNWPG